MGGYYNLNYVVMGSIQGGANNYVTGYGGSVMGGQSNSVQGSTFGSIGGGYLHTIWGDYGNVGGGGANKALSNYATSVGGFRNKANSRFGSVVGGAKNTVNGRYSLALGFNGRVKGDNSVGFSLLGGRCEVDESNTLKVCANQLLINGDDLISSLSRRQLTDDITNNVENLKTIHLEYTETVAEQRKMLLANSMKLQGYLVSLSATEELLKELSAVEQSFGTI